MATPREVETLVKSVAERYVGHPVELRHNIQDQIPPAQFRPAAIAVALRIALRAYGIIASIDSVDVVQARTWDDIAKRILERQAAPAPGPRHKEPERLAPEPTKPKRRAR